MDLGLSFLEPVMGLLCVLPVVLISQPLGHDGHGHGTRRRDDTSGGLLVVIRNGKDKGPSNSSSTC